MEKSTVLRLSDRERKATPRCLRHFIEEAVADKHWAVATCGNPEWFRRASTVSLEMHDEYLKRSILYLARKKMRYAKMRAFLGVGKANEWPWDKPAHDLWLKLNF
jgi:hypothetical protein